MSRPTPSTPPVRDMRSRLKDSRGAVGGRNPSRHRTAASKICFAAHLPPNLRETRTRWQSNPSLDRGRSPPSPVGPRDWLSWLQPVGGLCSGQTHQLRWHAVTPQRRSWSNRHPGPTWQPYPKLPTFASHDRLHTRIGLGQSLGHVDTTPCPRRHRQWMTAESSWSQCSFAMFFPLRSTLWCANYSVCGRSGSRPNTDDNWQCCIACPHLRCSPDLQLRAVKVYWCSGAMKHADTRNIKNPSHTNGNFELVV